MKSSRLVVGMAGLLLLLLVGTKFVEAGSITSLPSGPVLQPIRDFSRWEIDFAYAKDDEKEKAPSPTSSAPKNPLVDLSVAPPRSIIVIWTKSQWHSVTLDTRGSKTEQWSDGLNRFWTPPSQSSPMLVPSADASLLSLYDYGNRDFPDLSWLSADTFSGTQTIANHQCFVFTKDDIQAWVDTETRCPVQWKRGQETRTFHELSPPSDILSLPPDVAKVSRELEHDHEMLMRPIPKGG